MDVNMVVELIATLGFPIVAVVALGWFIFQIYKKSESREDTLMNEIAETRVVNAQAIATISKFADSLDVIKHDVEEIKGEVNIISDRINNQ